MPHTHSLEQASALADGLSDDGPDYRNVRELRVQLHALLKDQEEAEAA